MSYARYCLSVIFIVIFLFTLMTMDNDYIFYDTSSFRSPIIWFERHTPYTNDSKIIGNFINNTKREQNIQKQYPNSLHNNSMFTMFHNFPWDNIEESADHNQEEFSKYRQQLIDQLEEYVYLPPLVPINA